ncbi:MAG: MAPEG family protein [Betaproteobacteria bacterium]|nr:MAPEG family protein [Betaproteobacteria bacterium]
MAFDSTQSGVARGMVTAVAVAICSFAVAYVFQRPDVSSQTTFLMRLKLAAWASLAPASTLFLCIARMAKHRLFTPQDIQGSALTEGTERAKLLQSLLQNTLEQTVLTVPVYFAAALLFPPTLLPLVAAAGALFGVGRILFFSGYAGGAPSRATGFGLTFYPSVALLISVIAVGILHGDAQPLGQAERHEGRTP